MRVVLITTPVAEQFNGGVLLAGMARRDHKDSMGYQSKKPGLDTPFGFLPMEKGDWIVRLPSGDVPVKEADFPKGFVTMDEPEPEGVG